MAQYSVFGRLGLRSLRMCSLVFAGSLSALSSRTKLVEVSQDLVGELRALP